MAAEMKVTAQAIQAAQEAYYAADDSGSCQYAMTKAIEAALAAMLEPVGKLPDHGLQRLKTIGTVGWDDLFTLESDVPDAHIAYVIKESK